MRTIKFRLWDKKRTRYLFPYPKCDGNQYKFGEGDGPIPSFLIAAGNGKPVVYSGFGHISYPTYDEENYIVQQFTGLKDKNEKEIYEGDIVKFNKYTYQIIWSEENAAFVSLNKTNMAGAFLNPLYILNFEVIGSIHQNPELI